MIDTKKLGRPRTFDFDTALLAAMNVFWIKGYDGTSLKDLTRAMGISGPSMYAAFGDKRELFLKTIERYSDVDGCEPIVVFEAAPDIRVALRAFLEIIIKYATAHESGAKGCYLASTVTTNIGEVEGVDEMVRDAIHDSDERLARRFDQEIQKGNLPVNFPSKERASLLYDIRQGYMFRGRSGWTAQQLSTDIDYRIEMLLAMPK